MYFLTFHPQDMLSSCLNLKKSQTTFAFKRHDPKQNATKPVTCLILLFNSYPFMNF